jgi:hypothetical protein
MIKWDVLTFKSLSITKMTDQTRQLFCPRTRSAAIDLPKSAVHLDRLIMITLNELAGCARLLDGSVALIYSSAQS